MISIARALQMNVTDVFFLDWREYYGDWVF
jgi:hypothetical protein